MNSPEISRPNEAEFDAGMNKSVPSAEITSPNARPFAIAYPVEYVSLHQS